MKLPSNWSELTVRNYLKFKMSDDVLNQIAFLCGLDYYDPEIMTLTYKDVLNIRKSLKWMEVLPTESPKTIELNDLVYHKKPVNTINVFEWRTYDYYTRESSDNYIAHFIATMYQLPDEDWGYDVNERAKLFESVTMDNWSIEEWVNFKRLCFEKYPLASDAIPQEDIEDETYQERHARLDAERKAKVNNSLNWEKIMLSISNNSALEAYKAMSLPVLYVFRVITLLKDQ